MITNILRIPFTRSFKPLMLTDKLDYKLTFDTDELGIYVHIPFCNILCSFCPYNRIKYDKSLVEPFKDALLNEINMMGSLFQSKKTITSVYFGGGTPALMLEELGEIVVSLKKNFKINNNLGIELHPKDITPVSLLKLKKIGFDMVSIGVQSFQRSCLHSLGREYIDGAEKVRLAKQAGFKTIDVDLIFGMLNQSEENLRKDFLTAFASGATQVSTYPLIEFSYANNNSKPLGKQQKKQLLECLEKSGREIGCERTAVWTFAKRNTHGYSSITRDAFIGFGPSATSLSKEFFKINTFSIDEYIKCVNSGKVPTALTMQFSERTRALYWLFWNAYTLRLDNNKFKKLFKVNLDKIFKFELRIALLFGLLSKDGNSYILTKRGTYLYHLIEQRYTNQYIDKTWGIARQNAWPKKIKLY